MMSLKQRSLSLLEAFVGLSGVHLLDLPVFCDVDYPNY